MSVKFGNRLPGIRPLPLAAENIRPDNGWDKLRSYRGESIATRRRFYIPRSYTMWPSRRHAVTRLLCPSLLYSPAIHANPSYYNDTIFSLNICEAFGMLFSLCNVRIGMTTAVDTLIVRPAVPQVGNAVDCKELYVLWGSFRGIVTHICCISRPARINVSEYYCRTALLCLFL